MTGTTMKKTAGRRKIPIQKIENKVKRSVAFSKRKAGLFKKATELAKLCGSEIAVLVFSETGKAFTLGCPDADSVVQRYVHGPNPFNSTAQAQFGWDNCIDSMGLDELRLYSNYLKSLRDIVVAKATDVDGDSQLVQSDVQLTSSSDVDAQWVCDILADVDGDSQLVQSDVQLTSCSDVDAQWGTSLCDIQWEDDVDFLASFLHHH